MSFRYVPPPVVVDASVAVVLLTGEGAWNRTFDDWGTRDRMLLAPPHFLAEVANGLLLGRSRLPASDVLVRLEMLHSAGIETADEGSHGLREAITLAETHRLTVYDALYLQLALDVEGELATLDADLRKAAVAEDVPVTEPAH